MYGTNICGELTISDINQTVTLSGLGSTNTKKMGDDLIDLVIVGITQLVFNQETND